LSQAGSLGFDRLGVNDMQTLAGGFG
jgi:hypothetical protein